MPCQIFSETKGSLGSMRAGPQLWRRKFLLTRKFYLVIVLSTMSEVMLLTVNYVCVYD